MYDKPEGNTYRSASSHSTTIYFVLCVVACNNTINTHGDHLCVWTHIVVNPLLYDAAEPEMTRRVKYTSSTGVVSRPPPTDLMYSDAMRAFNVQALDGTIVVNVI